MKTMIALALAILPALAMAQEPGKVSFADLDLTTKEGVSALYLRIEVSARQVCGDPEQVVQTYAKAQIASCVKQTVAATVKRVRNQQLTQYAAAVR